MNADLIYDVGVNDGADTAFYLSLGIACSVSRRAPSWPTVCAITSPPRSMPLDSTCSTSAWRRPRESWSSAVGSTRVVVVQPRDRLTQRHAPPSGDGSYPAVRGHRRRVRSAVLLQDRHRGKRLPVPEGPHAGDSTALHLHRDVARRGWRRSRAATTPRVRQVQDHQPADPEAANTPGSLARLRFAADMVEESAASHPQRLGVHAVGDWKFAANSSGPFAEKTPGKWRSYDAAMRLWQFLRDVDIRYSKKGLADWFDIHACRSPPTSATTPPVARRALDRLGWKTSLAESIDRQVAEARPRLAARS